MKTSPNVTYTQNRELSWLQFNKRVLDEANDPTVPLYERLKFVAIFTSNLDEFFMVRVGSLTDLALVAPTLTENKSLMTPQQQLEAVYAAVRPLVQQKDAVYAAIMEKLADQGIPERSYQDLDEEELAYADQVFESTVLPFLSPLVIDARHPFPHLENKRPYVAVLLCNGSDCRLGLVAAPKQVPELVRLPQKGFIRTEALIQARLGSLFNAHEVMDCCIAAVTRNADLTEDEEKFDDDAPDYRDYMAALLKKRNRLNPVRLEVQGTPCPDLLNMILERLELQEGQAYMCNAPLTLGWAYSLESLIPAELRPELCYRPFSPRSSHVFQPGRSIAQQVKEADKLLFFPYDSMDPFLQLLKESATDPAVVSIKITLYRLASNSRIAGFLCDAAEAGKDVTVLVELRARFDEQNNIGWSERLEEAGCSIVYGPDSYKCHSKVCLITRLEEGRPVQITQIGTGNYNEKTSRFYTDISLLTANPRIGADATAFFQNMLVGNLQGSYQDLLVAPSNMHSTLCDLIEQQTRKGPEGRISMKCNSVTERAVIDALARASKAGVNIRMNVRGICCLRPGIEGATENVHVRSIVGRFLEHARIYCFGTGEEATMYVGSADLMTRNLRRRVEVLVPVLDPSAKRSLLTYLDVTFADQRKARQLQPDGTYVHVCENSAEGLSVQRWCMTHPLQEALPARAAQDCATNAAGAQPAAGAAASQAGESGGAGVHAIQPGAGATAALGAAAGAGLDRPFRPKEKGRPKTALEAVQAVGKALLAIPSRMRRR